MKPEGKKHEPEKNARAGRLNRIATDLVVNGSIELTSHKTRGIAGAAKLLPFGMSVFIPRHRKQSLDFNLDLMQSLHQVGFDPVPHIAARLIRSHEELKRFLAHGVNECGVHRVLLIGGDKQEPDGPYVDAAAVLHSGILSDAGIQEVGIAGYPEGHPRIPPNILAKDFEHKLKLAKDQNLGIHVITQFCFTPKRIVEYCSFLKRTAPGISIYVGLAGPTDKTVLLRYAQQCGVSASLRALSALGVKAARLTTHTDPDDQLTAVAQHCMDDEHSNIIGVHLFTFGGFVESARWMRRKLRHN